MKRLLGALFGAPLAAAPAAPAAHAAPPALVAPQLVETPRVVTSAPPIALAVTKPLRDAAAAHAAAIKDGCGGDRAMAHALAALAYADFSALELNGPHTRAGDRVSRKALKKARRVLMALAERELAA